MGIGASVAADGSHRRASQEGCLDTTWEAQTEGSWRSARSKELDKLGGPQRDAIKRGDSMQIRLEWLQARLEEQVEEVESALHKDPLGGRYEIIKQEQKKMVQESIQTGGDKAAGGGKRFSVREWQIMKHDQLRAQDAIARLSRSAVGGPNSLTQGLGMGERESRPSGDGVQDQIPAGDPTRPDWNKNHWTVQQKKEARVEEAAQRMRMYHLNLAAKASPKQKSVRQSAGPGGDRGRSLPNAAGSTSFKKTDAGSPPVSKWRENVFKAKKSAYYMLSTIKKLQAVSRVKPRILQRVSSFSVLIQEHLGTNLQSYVEAAAKYSTAKNSADQTKSLLDELHRFQEAKGTTSVDTSYASLAASPTSHPFPYSPATSPTSNPSPRSAMPQGPTTGGLRPTSQLRGRPSVTQPTSAVGTVRGARFGRHSDTGQSSSAPPVVLRGVGFGRHADNGDVSSPQSNGVSRCLVDLHSNANSAPLPSYSTPSPSASYSRPSPPSSAPAWGVKGRGTGAGLRTKTQQPRASALNSRSPKAIGLQDRGPPSAASKSSICSKGLTIGTDVEKIREFSLMNQLVVESSNMETPFKMMAMYAGRSNAKWADQQEFDPPTVYTPTNFNQIASGGQANLYRNEAAKRLQEGVFAFQVFVSDDYVHMSDKQTPTSLWSADPWKLIGQVLPGKHAAADCKIEGVTMGPRLIMALAAAFESTGGEKAAKHLCLVIHCTDDQEEQVVADLHDWDFCGLSPQNVIVVVQERRPMYAYDKESAQFVRRLGVKASSGSGFAMLQCTWPGEAYCLKVAVQDEGATSGPSKKLTKVYLTGSVLELLTTRGAKWLISRRLRDLSMYHPEHTIDLESLALLLFFKEQRGANMAVMCNVMPAANAHGYEGIVMAHKNHGGDINGRTMPSVVVKRSSLQSPQMTHVLNDLRTRGKQKLGVSSSSFVFSVETLTQVVSRLSVFHPALTFQGELAGLTFDVADLASDPMAHCVALQSQTAEKIISSRDDMEDLTSTMQAQESSGTFRKVLGASVGFAAKMTAARATLLKGPRTGMRETESPFSGPEDKGPRTPAKGGKVVVVFVIDNTATQVAVQLVLSILKASKDIVYFVTVAQSTAHEPSATDMCNKYAIAAQATLATPHVDVLSRGAAPLVEQLEEYVCAIQADLVVMGSQGLSEANALGIGSFTVSLLRFITKPLLVVKANAKNAFINWSKDKLKCMVAVEHSSRPMLNFVCQHVLKADRYDKLVLARGGGGDKAQQDTIICRRLVDNFNDIAHTHHFDGEKHLFTHSYEEEGPRVANANKVHIIAVQSPHGRSIPDKTVKLLRSSLSAVLLYRGEAAALGAL